jgi:phage N-6-adenine-methyltransferase
MTINKALYSSASDEWATPQDFYDRLNERFKFDLDPCASHENHKCERYFTMADNGLLQSWEGCRVFVNPPYSDIKSWVPKCATERALSVMLIPARTCTKCFHEHIYKKPNVDIEFIKGRLKFGNSKNSAPFPSMLVIFNNL